MIKLQLNTFDHFLKNTPNKGDFEFVRIDPIFGHPYHENEDLGYMVYDLYMLFEQSGEDSHFIYIPIQAWEDFVPIKYEELSDMEGNINYIAKIADGDDGSEVVYVYAKNGEESCIKFDIP